MRRRFESCRGRHSAEIPDPEPLPAAELRRRNATSAQLAEVSPKRRRFNRAPGGRKQNRPRQSKRSFATKKAAQASLAEAISAHESQSFATRSELTVWTYAVGWLESLERQGRKPSTLSGYRTQLRNYVEPYLGDVRLQDLTPHALDGLYSRLLRDGGVRGQPVSLSTVHHVHVMIGKMLNDAEGKGLVVRNVARLADAPSQSASRNAAPEMTIWTPEESSRFLAHAASSRSGAMVRLLALTGMRRGELVALCWSDVDLRHAQVTIRASASIHEGREIIDSPKSRRGRRTIDIDAETAAILRAHRRSQIEELLSLGVGQAERVFTNEIGEPLRPNSVGQAFRRLVAGCEGVPRIRLHDLRHTHASHLLAAGVNPRVVSERLGHSSVSFTLDTYGHVLPGQQADAAAAAAALLTRGEASGGS